MTADIEAAIGEAFPPAPLGKAAKELRSVHAMMGDGAGLDLISTWQDLVPLLLDGKIEGLSGRIHFMEGEAWRAVLPAWMVASLRNAATGRADLFGGVVVTLDPVSIWRTSQIFFERIAHLTPDQRRAVAEFVSWATRQPPLVGDPNGGSLIARMRLFWLGTREARMLTTVCVWGSGFDELLFEGKSAGLAAEAIRSVVGRDAFPEDPEIVAVHQITREQGMKLIGMMGFNFDGDGEFHVSRELVSEDLA